MDDVSSRRTAFLIECSDQSWVEVARFLGAEGIDVVYWTAWTKMRDRVGEEFPGAAFHNTIEAKRALPHPAFAAGERAPFSMACKTVWEADAQTLYEMMVRFDHGRDLIFAEASIHLYRMLIYWDFVLEQLQPDVVIFPTPPHVVYDYVILRLCETKGIETLLFEQVWIYPPYSMLMRNFKDGSPELRQRYAEVLAGPEQVPLSDRGRQVLDKLSGRYEAARPPTETLIASTSGHELDDQSFLEAEQDFLARNAELEARWYESLTLKARFEEWKARLTRRPPAAPVPYEKQVNTSSLAKQRGTSLRASFEGTWPNTRYLDQRLAQMVLTRERFAEYGSLCSALPRRGTPFIYVPLMFQPERTSCPQGGVFSNQFIMVNWLARLAPEGMLVCVKEHPTQLNPSMQATQARASEFYQELKTFPNVRLLSLDADPFETMDRCTAVATVAGTSAVEAVVRGRPALVFGASYYNDCVGIYPVDTEQDLASALAAIVRQPKVDRRAVEAFFYAIETALFEGNADLNLSSITQDSNAGTLAREIALRVRGNHAPASAQPAVRQAIGKAKTSAIPKLGWSG